MSVAGVLFDLEGVLLRAKTHEVLPYANDVLEFCREKQLPFGIITNNTVQRPESILRILNERDLGIAEAQLLTPLKFLRQELKQTETALVIGSDNLRQFVTELGVKVLETPDVDVVICGGSYSISNELLYSAFSAIFQSNSRFVCLHRNRVCNDATGITRPDVGCIVVGLEYSTGVQAKTIGKPSVDYFNHATQSWNIEAKNILLISDDPISDLGGAKKIGFQTGFVCTGKYGIDIHDKLETKPDMTWPTLEGALSDLATIT